MKEYFLYMRETPFAERQAWIKKIMKEIEEEVGQGVTKGSRKGQKGTLWVSNRYRARRKRKFPHLHFNDRGEL